MVKYQGLCRPLGQKVEFTVDEVKGLETSRGKKWQIKGHYQDYNISTFTSESIALDLITQLNTQPHIFDAEIAHIPKEEVYEMEELLPFPLAWKSEEAITMTQEVEEEPESEDTPDMEEAVTSGGAKINYDSQGLLESTPSMEDDMIESGLESRDVLETTLNSAENPYEGLPKKYLKSDGTPDMRYKICKEWLAGRDVAEEEKEDSPSIPVVEMEDELLIEGNKGEMVETVVEVRTELNPNTLTIPKSIYYEMIDIIPDTVTAQDTLDGTSVTLGFLEFDSPLMESIFATQLPESDEDITIMEAESMEPEYAFSAEELRAERSNKMRGMFDTEEEDEDRGGQFQIDLECNYCGGILNPAPERGPYKPRQLCDCNTEIGIEEDEDSFDAEDDLKVKTLKGGKEVYAEDMRNAEDKDQKAYFRGVITAFDATIAGMERYGEDTIVEQTMLVLIPTAMKNFQKLEEAGLRNDTYYYNAGKISGYEEIVDFLNPYGVEFIREMSAEAKDLKFKEWADEELNDEHHEGSEVTFDEWLDEEIKEHGDVTLSEWKKDEHDEKSHQAETQYFDSEVKNVLENYVEVMYPNSADAQEKLMNEILSGKVDIDLDRMREVVDRGSEWPDWKQDMTPEEDVFEEIEWQSEVKGPKTTTLAAMLGLGALAAALAPREIRELFRRMGK